MRGMHIAILGRQPKLGMAELERYFGSDSVRWFSSNSATIATDSFSIEQLGGSLKAGTVTLRIPRGNWRQTAEKIIRTYSEQWSNHEGKITLGISEYGFNATPRDVQHIGIVIKKNLKRHNVSVRLIPNTDSSLNTAVSHHNKLGLAPNKVELLIVHSESGDTIVAESTGAQNITALAARDQARPRRDAFVGMLPPKLARLMLNLATASHPGTTVLDAFCGTGVILQEAWLNNSNVIGTDLSEKMVDYSQENMRWLTTRFTRSGSITIDLGDAMTASWPSGIDAVVSETYLGQPFSAPPSPQKLDEVKKNVNHIVSTFLKNLHPQIAPGTPLCLAVPAWRGSDTHITHLPLIRSLEELGYATVQFQHVRPNDLIYYRENQVVARELLVITRK